LMESAWLRIAAVEDYRTANKCADRDRGKHGGDNPPYSRVKSSASRQRER
jgi:hypothetical protein